MLTILTGGWNNPPSGIFLTGSNYNTINSNTLTSNDNGIYVTSSSSSNEIYSNKITASGSNGIYINTGVNTIYNNIFNNTNNFQISNTNNWNTTKTLGKNIVGGKYIGGNYWAKPDGTGFSETCNDTNYDSICDEVYSLDSNNNDTLALAKITITTPSITYLFDTDDPITLSEPTFFGSGVNVTINSNNITLQGGAGGGSDEDLADGKSVSQVDSGDADGTGCAYGCQTFTCGTDKATDNDVSTAADVYDDDGDGVTGWQIQLDESITISEVRVYFLHSGDLACWACDFSDFEVQVYDYSTNSWVTPTGWTGSYAYQTWFNFTDGNIQSDKVRVYSDSATWCGMALAEIEIYADSGYKLSGYYLSPILDANVTKYWDNAVWNYDKPAGTNISLKVRSKYSTGIKNPSYRIITINSTENVNDVQVLIKLNSSNFDFENSTDDGRDIRFFDSNNNSISYWIESWDKNSEYANIWIKVNLTTGENQFRMYYGNPNLEPASTNSIFEFFDDFDSSANWNVYQTNEISDGYAKLDTTGTGARIIRKDAESCPFIFEAKYIMKTAGAEGRLGTWDTDSDSSSRTGYYLAIRDNDDTFYLRKDDGSWNGVTMSSTSYSPQVDVPIIAKLVIGDGTHKEAELFSINRTSLAKLTASDNTYNSQNHYILFVLQDGGEYWVDWIFVRKYISSEPVVSVGSRNEDSEGLLYSKWQGYEWSDWQTFTSSPADLSNLTGRYIQYKVEFSTTNESYTPTFYNITITNKENITAGQNVYYRVDWADQDSTQAKLFICSTNSSTSSGCNDTSYCSTSLTTDNPIICSYNTSSLSSGTYDYYAFVYDENFSIVSNDITPPFIQIIYPENTTYNKIITELNYTVSDDADTCWYSTDNGATNTTITCGQNITGLTANEGSNTWIVWANDTAGNVNSSSVTFIVDTTAPSIQFVPPTTESGTYNQNYILANVTASDSSGIDTITIYLYNSTALVRVNTSSTSPFFWNISDLVDGTYYLNASVNDTAGNYNTTETRTILLDTTPPQVTILSPENKTYNYNNININVTANEDISTWILNWNGTNQTFTPNITYTFPDGQINLTIYAKDVAGNWNSSNVTFSVLSIIPFVEIKLNTSVVEYIYGSINITWNVTNADSFELNVSNSTDLIYQNTTHFNGSVVLSNFTSLGTYTVSLSAENEGVTNSTTKTFVVQDSTPPSITLIEPLSEQETAEVTFIFSVFDYSEPIKCFLFVNKSHDVVKYNYSVTATSNINYSKTFTLENGNWIWGVICEDNQSNVNTSQFRFDVDVPYEFGGGSGDVIEECCDGFTNTSFCVINCNGECVTYEGTPYNITVCKPKCGEYERRINGTCVFCDGVWYGDKCIKCPEGYYFYKGACIVKLNYKNKTEEILKKIGFGNSLQGAITILAFIVILYAVFKKWQANRLRYWRFR